MAQQTYSKAAKIYPSAVSNAYAVRLNVSAAVRVSFCIAMSGCTTIIVSPD